MGLDPQIKDFSEDMFDALWDIHGLVDGPVPVPNRPSECTAAMVDAVRLRQALFSGVYQDVANKMRDKAMRGNFNPEALCTIAVEHFPHYGSDPVHAFACSVAFVAEMALHYRVHDVKVASGVWAVFVTHKLRRPFFGAGGWTALQRRACRDQAAFHFVAKHSEKVDGTRVPRHETARTVAAVATVQRYLQWEDKERVPDVVRFADFCVKGPRETVFPEDLYKHCTPDVVNELQVTLDGLVKLCNLYDDTTQRFDASETTPEKELSRSVGFRLLPEALAAIDRKPRVMTTPMGAAATPSDANPSDDIPNPSRIHPNPGDVAAVSDEQYSIAQRKRDIIARKRKEIEEAMTILESFIKSHGMPVSGEHSIFNDGNSDNVARYTISDIEPLEEEMELLRLAVDLAKLPPSGNVLPLFKDIKNTTSSLINAPFIRRDQLKLAKYEELYAQVDAALREIGCLGNEDEEGISGEDEPEADSGVPHVKKSEDAQTGLNQIKPSGVGKRDTKTNSDVSSSETLKNAESENTRSVKGQQFQSETDAGAKEKPKAAESENVLENPAEADKKGKKKKKKPKKKLTRFLERLKQEGPVVHDVMRMMFVLGDPAGIQHVLSTSNVSKNQNLQDGSKGDDRTLPDDSDLKSKKEERKLLKLSADCATLPSSGNILPLSEDIKNTISSFTSATFHRRDQLKMATDKEIGAMNDAALGKIDRIGNGNEEVISLENEPEAKSGASHVKKGEDTPKGLNPVKPSGVGKRGRKNDTKTNSGDVSSSETLKNAESENTTSFTVQQFQSETDAGAKEKQKSTESDNPSDDIPNQSRIHLNPGVVAAVSDAHWEEEYALFKQKLDIITESRKRMEEAMTDVKSFIRRLVNMQVSGATDEEIRAMVNAELRKIGRIGNEYEEGISVENEPEAHTSSEVSHVKRDEETNTGLYPIKPSGVDERGRKNDTKTHSDDVSRSETLKNTENTTPVTRQQFQSETDAGAKEKPKAAESDNVLENPAEAEKKNPKNLKRFQERLEQEVHDVMRMMFVLGYRAGVRHVLSTSNVSENQNLEGGSNGGDRTLPDDPDFESIEEEMGATLPSSVNILPLSGDIKNTISSLISVPFHRRDQLKMATDKEIGAMVDAALREIDRIGNEYEEGTSGEN